VAQQAGHLSVSCPHSTTDLLRWVLRKAWRRPLQPWETHSRHDHWSSSGATHDSQSLCRPSEDWTTTTGHWGPPIQQRIQVVLHRPVRLSIDPEWTCGLAVSSFLRAYKPNHARHDQLVVSLQTDILRLGSALRRGGGYRWGGGGAATPSVPRLDGHLFGRSAATPYPPPTSVSLSLITPVFLFPRFPPLRRPCAVGTGGAGRGARPPSGRRHGRRRHGRRYPPCHRHPCCAGPRRHVQAVRPEPVAAVVPALGAPDVPVAHWRPAGRAPGRRRRRGDGSGCGRGGGRRFLS